ncbi:CAP domain-containing protein [Aurantimonas marianensis]|uniref:CAP domain-containing protein n=1 Tax=Aurantimonas marianensis TaxID=2920428 RepID=A0A9X2H272_9HYPH|nr:CAP domain-containing protein [Aurantimonas marianensis]MCP3054285.1 CAP domain-containing protein [Aurantimonas marianensis]
MRLALTRFLVLFPVALLAACVGATGAIDVTSTKPLSVDRGTALASINAFRAQNGLGSVRFDAVLDKAADRQARAMAARGDLSHSLDGALPSRVTSFGYNWAAVSENIGWNYRSTPAVIAGWKNSPGHRRNLLNPNVTEIGFSAATGSNGQPYWALILGRQKQR